MGSYYTLLPMKKEPSRIAAIVKNLAKDLGLEAGMDLYILQSQWQSLVGKPLSAHAFPQTIQYKVLTLQVDSAPWMQELNYLKAELIQKLNQALGKPALQSIRLKLAPIAPVLDPLLRVAASHSEKPQAPAALKALSQEDKDLLLHQLDSVSDDALKETIRAAMTHHLRREEPV